MGSLKRNTSAILAQVPTEVSRLLVVCFKHKTPIGAMSVSWQDVTDYLRGQLTGYQLGERASRAAIP